MMIENYKVHDNGIYIPLTELKRCFEIYRNKGCDNFKLYSSGIQPALYDSVKSHAKADLLYDLISTIENELN